MQHFFTSVIWENAYQIHPEGDIAWLQRFCEAVAQMEKVFPEVLEEIKDPS
jgi:hypothetical protein